jgi:hypothetical protein
MENGGIRLMVNGEYASKARWNGERYIIVKYEDIRSLRALI